MKTETADEAWNGKPVMQKSITKIFKVAQSPTLSSFKIVNFADRSLSFEFVSPSFSFLHFTISSFLCLLGLPLVWKGCWLGSKEESPTAVF